ncbi:hypothetical protein ABT160_36110 [Streptomyces sp. NPDC001941]|uniref:hypothetical protein n=1 Tax=Streptomyces sp. NPDC001941 TaxID=3154659 RepID=UPI0033335A90
MSTAPDPTAPRADCLADSAGGVTFDIADPGTPRATLVLRQDRGDEEVRLPLAPAGGVLRAVLPGTVDLAEGFWGVYVDDVPVRPGVRDLRALVDRVPGGGHVSVRIPYPTPEGALGIRSWVREPHAEAGDLALGPGTVTVEGRLYGAVAGPDAVALARLGEEVREVPLTAEGPRFRFTVDHRELAAAGGEGTRLWGLWVRPSADAAPVRVARLLDDLWNRRDVYVYPEHTGDGWRAGPLYSTYNELYVTVTGTVAGS